MKYLKFLKKWDIIIIVMLIVMSFIPEGILLFSSGTNYSSIYAEISIRGKLHKKIRLDNHQGSETITIKNSYGTNIIQIKDNSFAIIEADCPDKVCEKPGFIKNPGETLVCLPHKLIVEIKGDAKLESDVLSY